MLVEMQIGAALIDNSMVVPQKLKNGTVSWPSVFISGYISEKKPKH